MRSALLSQAEMHALLYSGHNDAVEFDMLGIGPVGDARGGAFSLSGDLSPNAELPQPKVCIAPKHFFQLDPILINCADPVTNQIAEVGITFQIREAKNEEDVKNILPSLRSAILITLSQKTSEELLSRHGKEKLANDLLMEVARVFGVTPHPAIPVQAITGSVEDGTLKIQNDNPVLEVLFSSLIVHQAAS